MRYNYNEIVKLIDKDVLLHSEGDFVYFLNTNPQKGSLLLQEFNDHIEILNNELKNIKYIDLYTLFIKNINVPIYVVYIENKEEYDAVIQLQAKEIEYKNDDLEVEANNFGSFMINKI